MIENPKIAFVIPRYGKEILGGAEIHCRWIAERLAQTFSVEILTTCANDASLWKNYFPPGKVILNGIQVNRFSISNRDKDHFKLLEVQRQLSGLSKDEGRNWLRHMGPYSQDLLDYLKIYNEDYDCFIFFTYLFPTTVFGAQLVSDKAFLVPTVHDEPYVYLSVYQDLFNAARGVLFNCVEEKEFTLAQFPNMTARNIVVGCGIDFPENPTDPSSFKQMHGIDKPYIAYVGKISSGKGCDQLVDFFMRYCNLNNHEIQLVMIGSGEMVIPKHSLIKAVGPVSEDEKYSLLAEAVLLVNPSKNESLSLALLESWAMNTPVLVNGKSAVMTGQCRRSSGGLWYENCDEFFLCLNWFFENPELASKLGRNGKRYLQSTYNWKVIEKKYLTLLSTT